MVNLGTWRLAVSYLGFKLSRKDAKGYGYAHPIKNQKKKSNPLENRKSFLIRSILKIRGQAWLLVVGKWRLAVSYLGFKLSRKDAKTQRDIGTPIRFLSQKKQSNPLEKENPF